MPATEKDVLQELESILEEYIRRKDNNSKLKREKKGGKKMPELANSESRKPASTEDVSKVIFSILDRAKELNIIVSEVNSELVGSPMEVHEEKDLAKKASKGWLEDKYRTLCEIKGEINRAFEKVQLLKSRLKTER